ncbi:tyrosine-type recombinase/integrase [Oscillospiraceae bacterium 50-58]
MYGPDCVGRLHKTLLKKAGITEKVRFRDLRHTFATLAIQSGVDAKTVSSILGHYSVGFTLDTYTHVTEDMQKEAAKRVGGLIAQAV